MKKVILYVSPNAHLGGAERVCEILIKGHDRNLFDPLIAFLRDGPLVEKFRKYQVPVYLLPFTRLRDLHRHGRVLETLEGIIERHGVDLVHSSMAYGHVFGGRAANRKGIKNVWFQHGPVGGSLDWLASRIKSEKIFVNSQHTLEAQKKLWGKSGAIEVVQLGVESPSAHKSELLEDRNRFRDANGIPRDAFLFGSVGRIQEWKGQDKFLEAFFKAAEQNPNFWGVIVGSADIGSERFRKKIESMVSRSRNQRIKLVGFIEAMDKVYPAIDLLVHSAIRPEPFGLVILEAMSYGIPVIASPLGGAR